MPANSNGGRRARLYIDAEPELRRRVEIAAAKRGLSVSECLEILLRRALEEEERESARMESEAWSRLSARSFARDWDSEADRGYDRLA